jgi:hypothetical protein
MTAVASRRNTVALLLAVWGCCGLARVTLGEARALARRAEMRGTPFNWRFGQPQPERLRRCLETVSRHVPAGASVQVVGRHDDIYTWRWAAYLLPQYDVLPASEVPVAVPGSTPARAEYLVATAPEVPRHGTAVVRRDWCAIYRLR